MKIHPVFNQMLLHLAPTDGFQRSPQPLPPIVTAEGEEEYEVEQILDSKMEGRSLFYYVKWKGYGPEENSWEPKANVANSSRLIQKFHREHPDAVGP